MTGFFLKKFIHVYLVVDDSKDIKKNLNKIFFSCLLLSQKKNKKANITKIN